MENDVLGWLEIFVLNIHINAGSQGFDLCVCPRSSKGSEMALLVCTFGGGVQILIYILCILHIIRT